MNNLAHLHSESDSPVADLTEAQRLLDNDFTLVRLHDFTKRPIGDDWNKKAADYIAPDATGYGLPLARNRLCSIDPDHVDMARAGLAAWGFDLDDLLSAGVRTRSTRPGSGGRSAFAEDHEEMCRWLSFRVFDDEGKSTTVLELRAKSANLQDCVPGVIYKDAKTGRVYSQEYAGDKRFDDKPSLPDEFARLWRQLSIDDESLREYERKFYEGIVSAGFMVNGKKPVLLPSMGSGEKLPFEAKGIRGEFNRKHTPADIIDRHGYRYHANIDRWSHPGATGAPGIRPIPGKDDLWRSDHAGDPLHGTFDAWAAYVQLDHKGDVGAAVAAYTAERQAAIPEGSWLNASGEEGQPVSLPSIAASNLAWQVDKRLQDRVIGINLAESGVKADPAVIDAMINGAFWSGSKSKLFLLNEDQSLLQFRETEANKYLTKRFGQIIDRQTFEKAIEPMSFGKQDDASGEESETAKEKRRKFIASCMNDAKDVVMDYIKYNNQRDSLEWRVDMFASKPRLVLLEDKARIVLTHKPFVANTSHHNAEVVADYKQHFPRFDEFLSFLVMSRFARDRKKAYLWLLADSDWGKGFLMTGIIGSQGGLGATTETSVREIEAMFEGKPVGRAPEEFKRSFALVVDEFKTVKSEIKQLQSQMSLAPKHQLTCSVEIFAKVFMSAESVASLVTENGVEDQFANRMSIFIEKGSIDKRELFNTLGKPRYQNALVAYAAEFMNREIDALQAMAELDAQDHAERWLGGFIGRNGLDTVYERFSDSLERVAMEAIEWLHKWHNMSDCMLKDTSSGRWYLKRPRLMVDKFLEETFDRSEVNAYRKRKPEILMHMSADGKGDTNHRVNGKPDKTVMLKAVGSR